MRIVRGLYQEFKKCNGFLCSYIPNVRKQNVIACIFYHRKLEMFWETFWEKSQCFFTFWAISYYKEIYNNIPKRFQPQMKIFLLTIISLILRTHSYIFVNYSTDNSAHYLVSEDTSTVIVSVFFTWIAFLSAQSALWPKEKICRKNIRLKASEWGSTMLSGLVNCSDLACGAVRKDVVGSLKKIPRRKCEIDSALPGW